MRAGQRLEVKHVVICCICASKFKAKMKRAKYCSMRCKNRAARNRRAALCGQCLHCAGDILTGKLDQKYCSISCGLAATKPNRIVVCLDCESKFTYNGRGRCYRCKECRRLNNSYRARLYATASGKNKNPGVGSGGAQFGADNHQWLGGHSTPYKGNYRNTCFKFWDKECVVCGCDTDVEVHHVDGDGGNHSPSNLIPLCHEHHWNVHSNRNLTSDELFERLELIWANCRCKIAEKTGNSGSRQPELKA